MGGSEAGSATYALLAFDPPFDRWGSVLQDNLAWAADLPGGLSRVREEAREWVGEYVGAAASHSGVPSTTAPGSVSGTHATVSDSVPLIVTGHQPDLWHPGIRAKAVLAGRLAHESGGLPIDIVVDTDDVGRLGFLAPVGSPRVDRTEVLLAEHPPGVPYAAAPVPGPAAIAAFRAHGRTALGTLPSAAPLAGFRQFCDALESAAETASDLGRAVTAARRAIDTGSAVCHEVPMSEQARSSAFRRFAAIIFADAERFRVVYNDALATYRRATGTRSSAQPVPDLAVDGDLTEVPFWILDDGRRKLTRVGPGGVVHADDIAVCRAGGSADAICEALASDRVMLAPKALTLTMFERLFVADLFIHGTGGGRYDAVTDAVIRGFFGIEPPRFVVASMTARAPLGIRVPEGRSLAEIDHMLHRLKHNPDALIDEYPLHPSVDRSAVEAIAERKRTAVSAMVEPDADRKALGRAVKAMNAEMAELLEPMAATLRAEREQAVERDRVSEIAGDRTYPFFMHDLSELDRSLA